MSVTSRDNFFEGLESNYYFLGDLPIGNVYPVFYLDDIGVKISDLNCNSFTLGNYSDNCNCPNLISSVHSVLAYINGMIDAGIVDNNVKWCEYLSYYIYENIPKIKSCKNTEQLYTELDRSKKLYSKLSNNCIISNFTIGKDAFEKKKKLYLLAEILYWIEEECKKKTYLQYYSYEKFFGECASIYNQIITEDNCKINEDYKKELLKLKDNFNSAKAYLNEKKNSITHADLKSPDASMCTKELNGSQEENVQDRGIAQEFSEEAGHIGQEGVTRAGALAKQSLEPVSGSRVGIADHVGHMSVRDSGLPKEQTDENISSPVGTIVGTSLGFVLPLITIYKFTPLGLWINTKILGRKKILKNMERNNQHLLLNSKENTEINLGETMYRIKYNS